MRPARDLGHARGLPVGSLVKRPKAGIACQSALDWDPLSASKRDPFERRVLAVALAPSELAGVAEIIRHRPFVRDALRRGMLQPGPARHLTLV
jgi:hypothetical protein